MVASAANGLPGNDGAGVLRPGVPGFPPAHVLGCFLHGLVFPVEDVTGLAQCGVDLVERGVVGGAGQRSGNLQGGSRAGLTAGRLDASEFTEFVLQRLDTAGGVIRHALRRIPFGLCPAEL